MVSLLREELSRRTKKSRLKTADLENPPFDPVVAALPFELVAQGTTGDPMFRCCLLILHCLACVGSWRSHFTIYLALDFRAQRTTMETALLLHPS